MNRKSAKVLIKRILKSIGDSPKSISEIARDCESNWESIKVYLESLKETGIVKETEIANKRVFSVPKCCVTNESGNYFDLPIKPDDSKLINSLFLKIKEEWQRKIGNLPGQTQVQKSLARIAKIEKLELPIGWYLFGPICVKAYDPSIDYGNSIGIENLNPTIIKVVEDFSTETSAVALKLRYYKEENNILYNTKEILLSLFSSAGFSKKRIKEINTLLYRLLGHLPPIFDEKAKSLINDYVGIVLQLLNSLPEEDLQMIRNDVYSAFNEIWKLIALYNYFTDLEPYYTKNYSREIELKHFMTDMNLQKFEVIEYLKYLKDFIPTKTEPDDETYRKLKQALGSIELFSAEEQEERKRNLEQKEKELGPKEFQKWLLKQLD